MDRKPYVSILPKWCTHVHCRGAH